MRHLLMSAALLALAAPVAAQTQAPTASPAQPPAGQPAAGRPATPGAPPKLVFEREVYSYPGAAGRRDPFLPLVGQNAAGPLFQDLQLRGIVYSAESPARSVASLLDASKKVHVVRRGDVVGNATVLDIGRRRVLFSVEDFGIRRQEVLELRPTNREGA
jgi:hypothetical protein